MNWVALGAIAEIAGAAGSIAIACVAVYIGIRQWVDGKRFSREQRELTERIERNNDASKLEQERIIRAQAAATENGVLVVDIWESEESLGQFAEKLMPIIARTGATLPEPRILPLL